MKKGRKLIFALGIIVLSLIDMYGCGGGADDVFTVDTSPAPGGSVPGVTHDPPLPNPSVPGDSQPVAGTETDLPPPGNNPGSGDDDSTPPIVFGPPPQGDPSAFTGPLFGLQFAGDFLTAHTHDNESAFKSGLTGTSPASGAPFPTPARGPAPVQDGRIRDDILGHTGFPGAHVLTGWRCSPYFEAKTRRFPILNGDAARYDALPLVRLVRQVNGKAGEIPGQTDAGISYTRIPVRMAVDSGSIMEHAVPFDGSLEVSRIEGNGGRSQPVHIYSGEAIILNRNRFEYSNSAAHPTFRTGGGISTTLFVKELSG